MQPSKIRKSPTKWISNNILLMITMMLTVLTSNTNSKPSSQPLGDVIVSNPTPHPILVNFTNPSDFGFVAKDPEVDSGSDSGSSEVNTPSASEENIETESNINTISNKALAEVYIKNKKAKIDRTYHETEFDIYLVSYATLIKIQPVIDTLKTKLSSILGEKCRDSMKWFKRDRIDVDRKPGTKKQNVKKTNVNGTLTKSEVCFNTKIEIDQQLAELESIVSANQKFRQDAEDFREQNLQFESNYETILRNTLGNYSVESSRLDNSESSSQDNLLSQGYVNDEIRASAPPGKKRSHRQNPNIHHNNKNQKIFIKNQTPLYAKNARSSTQNAKTEKTAVSCVASCPPKTEAPPPSPSLSDLLHKIQGQQDTANQIMQFQQILLNTLKTEGLQNNPNIFKIASHIKNANSKIASKMSLLLKPNFPPTVQQVTWGDRAKLLVDIDTVKNKNLTLKLSAYKDGLVKTQKVPENDKNENDSRRQFRRRQNFDFEGDEWKFLPLQDGNCFAIYNIMSKSALVVNFNGNRETQPEIRLDSLKLRDISMLPSEFCWQLSLECDPVLAGKLRIQENIDRHEVEVALADSGIIEENTVLDKHGEPVAKSDDENIKNDADMNDCPREALLLKISNKWALNMTLGVNSKGNVSLGDQGQANRVVLFKVY